MPAARPLPSIVLPLRSNVMSFAPTTRPSHRQSAMSLLSLMLNVMTWPQKIVVLTGAATIVHEYTAGDGSTFRARSTARTWNARAPTSRPVYVLGEVHGAHVVPAS